MAQRTTDLMTQGPSTLFIHRSDDNSIVYNYSAGFCHLPSHKPLSGQRSSGIQMNTNRLVCL